MFASSSTAGSVLCDGSGSLGWCALVFGALLGDDVVDTSSESDSNDEVGVGVRDGTSEMVSGSSLYPISGVAGGGSLKDSNDRETGRVGGTTDGSKTITGTLRGLPGDTCSGNSARTLLFSRNHSS